MLSNSRMSCAGIRVGLRLTATGWFREGIHIHGGTECAAVQPMAQERKRTQLHGGTTGADTRYFPAFGFGGPLRTIRKAYAYLPGAWAGSWMCRPSARCSKCRAGS